MRATRILSLALWMSTAGAAPATGIDTVSIDVDRSVELKERLIVLAQERLRLVGLVIDPERASLRLSGALRTMEGIELRPVWSAAGTISSPLLFEISSPTQARPLLASLAVPLQRQVPVATRRLRRGSVVSCADVESRLRDLGRMPKTVWTAPCESRGEVVALRDLSKGDVVLAGDVGRAPAVMTGSQVRVSVTLNGINVSTVAVALSDAHVGDRVDVRLLQLPVRTLKARVMAPGAAQLLDELQ
jgi:flagella basal body P-ring formation protein FlgA